MSYRCPAPPHNTTSFLMNYHKDEVTGQDSLLDFLDETSMGLRPYTSGSFIKRTASFSYDPVDLPPQ